MLIFVEMKNVDIVIYFVLTETRVFRGRQSVSWWTGAQKRSHQILTSPRLGTSVRYLK